MLLPIVIARQRQLAIDGLLVNRDDVALKRGFLHRGLPIMVSLRVLLAPDITIEALLVHFAKTGYRNFKASDGACSRLRNEIFATRLSTLWAHSPMGQEAVLKVTHFGVLIVIACIHSLDIPR